MNMNNALIAVLKCLRIVLVMDSTAAMTLMAQELQLEDTLQMNN